MCITVNGENFIRRNFCRVIFSLLEYTGKNLKVPKINLRDNPVELHMRYVCT